MRRWRRKLLANGEAYHFRYPFPPTNLPFEFRKAEMNDLLPMVRVNHLLATKLNGVSRMSVVDVAFVVMLGTLLVLFIII